MIKMIKMIQMITQDYNAHKNQKKQNHKELDNKHLGQFRREERRNCPKRP